MPLHGFFQPWNLNGRRDQSKREVPLIKSRQPALERGDSRGANEELRHEVKSCRYYLNSPLLAKPLDEPLVKARQLLEPPKPHHDVSEAFQKPCNADLRTVWGNQLKAKLLCPFSQRSDLLLAIPGFVIFGSFVHVLLAVFDEPVEEAG